MWPLTAWDVGLCLSLVDESTTKQLPSQRKKSNTKKTNKPETLSPKPEALNPKLQAEDEEDAKDRPGASGTASCVAECVPYYAAPPECQ